MSQPPGLLLVGGTGFVGGYLAPALKSAFPHHRHVVLRRNDPLPAPPGWDVETADLLSASAVDDVIARVHPDIVVHLAAQSSVGAAAHAAEETWRINFDGTLALASAVARHAPTGTFLFASTGEVYGRSLTLGPAHEETTPMPQGAYAASKFAAELMLRDVLPSTIRLIVTRAFNHTGPGQTTRFVLPSFAAQIAEIERGVVPPILRVGNLSAERDFLHVADVVDAYVRLLQTPSLNPRLLVNVASGEAIAVASLLDTLRSYSTATFDIEIDQNRLRPSDIPRAVGDSSLLTRITGWRPRYSLDETLAEVMDAQRRRAHRG